MEEKNLAPEAEEKEAVSKHFIEQEIDKSSMVYQCIMIKKQ